MPNEFAEINEFLLDWSEEFSRAVEMFTGEKADVSASPVTPVAAAELVLANYLWWKQEFEGNPVFTTWIGAEEGSWSPLGGAMASAGDDPKQLFFEMLGQAQQGAGTLQVGHSGHELRCRAGSAEAPLSSTSLLLAKIEITFKGQPLAPVCYLLDANAAKALQPEPEPEQPVAANEAPGLEQTYGPMLGRIMDLDLPLSVALGRAILPIQDILKLTSGSLIELDRKVGQSVELLIHGKVVAKGDVVSVKGNYAIRIKEIISRSDRLALHQK